jgi:hypothetical protein
MLLNNGHVTLRHQGLIKRQPPDCTSVVRFPEAVVIHGTIRGSVRTSCVTSSLQSALLCIPFRPEVNGVVRRDHDGA